MISTWANQIRQRSAVLDLSQAQLAALSNISQARLSRCLSGLETLSNEHIHQLDEVLSALESLVELVPFPLNLRDVERIKDLLSQLKRGDLGRVLVLPVCKDGSELLAEAQKLNTRS